MTETPWPKLAQIWLRRSKKFVLAFRFYTLETATHLKITTKKWGVSHMCASLAQKNSKLLIFCKVTKLRVHLIIEMKPLRARSSYISLSNKPRVSLKSVSFGSFWRSHIRHPPIFYQNIKFQWFSSSVSKKTETSKYIWMSKLYTAHEWNCIFLEIKFETNHLLEYFFGQVRIFFVCILIYITT